jgi:two-component system chemotaxis response regulator CheB
MISTLTSQGSEQTLRALELGAVDYVQKPGPGSVGNLAELEDAICTRLRVAARARVRRLAAQEPRDAVPSTGAQVAARGRLLFIGASTGGTEAIRDVLAGLPADGPPILVAQHMPAGFTRTFARRLDATCPMHVSEAEDGEPVLPGHAYIAPGSHHLLIERRGGRYWIALSDAPEVNRHRPSVDVLFRSAASVVGSRAVGVILTGMGRDGAAGLAAMRAAGAYNLAQDEASCVVFGMPREAIAAGAAHEVVSLPQMARHVYDALGRPAHGAPTVGANSAGVTA